MNSNIHQIQIRIAFLQEQLDSLEHYLPETYQFLMNEMDTQQRKLMELKIQLYYQQQSNEKYNQDVNTGYSEQNQKSDYQRKGVCH
jgi:hypothetical protein